MCPLDPRPPPPDSEVFVLPPKPLDLIQLTDDLNDALMHAGASISTPLSVAPFNWLEPTSSPPEVPQAAAAEPLSGGAPCSIDIFSDNCSDDGAVSFSSEISDPHLEPPDGGVDVLAGPSPSQPDASQASFPLLLRALNLLTLGQCRSLSDGALNPSMPAVPPCFFAWRWQLDAPPRCGTPFGTVKNGSAGRGPGSPLLT